MAGSRRRAAVAGLIGGAVLLGGLFAWRGIAAVVGLLEEAGWALALVCLFTPPEQWLSAEAWRRLFPPAARPGRGRALWASWMGGAVNALLPVATIGGEIVKARAVMLWGAPAAETIAATTVDKTAQAIAILIWGLIGAACLTLLVGLTGTVTGVLIGAGILCAGIGGFIAVQVAGGASLIAGRLTPWLGPELGAALTDGAAALDAAMRAIYREPRWLLASIGLRVLQRAMLAAEVVLIGALMASPIGIVEAVALKGLIGALRGMAFAVPAGIGVQEGGYVALGALLGYPPDLMIAVSLATRLREILLNIPLLLAWQAMEGRALWRRHG